MKNKKNIMFVIPTLIGGGAEKTVANLSCFLSKNYNVYIVVLNDTSEKYNYDGNLIVLDDDNKKRNKIYNKTIRRIKLIKKLKKLKKELNIYCSISFLYQADIINVFSKCHEKCYVSIRNKDSALLEKKIYKYVTKKYLRKCDKVISISKQVKDDLIDNFRINENKISVIYNPSLAIEFNKKNLDLNDSVFSKDITFVNMGRLTNQKGQWHLIRAFKKVCNVNKNAKLLILGTGELNDYLNKLINDLNLNNNVILMGFLNNPYDYLKRSDVFVFSSLFEGLGNSILEAMNCNLPIISTDCDCGPREILAPDTEYKNKVKDKYEISKYGILVPNFDDKHYSSYEEITDEEAILSDAMIYLMNNRNVIIEMKENIKKRIKDFDIEKITKEWIDAIDE